MTDNGARALAERLRELYQEDVDNGNPPSAKSADAILANGGVFLPDAAELDRLRRIEAAAREVIRFRDRIAYKDGAEMLALRATLQPTDAVK